MKKLLIPMLIASALLLTGCGSSSDETTTRPINENPTEQTTQTTMTEPLLAGERYVYHAADGKYASYVQGKVIDEARIGEKLLDADFIGGWYRYPAGTCDAQQTLKAEIYEIQDISDDIAVAVKFIDQGDSLTTTHYYVIINPDADIEPIAEYFIPDPFR